MKTKDSAIQWTEANLIQLVKFCDGTIGPTTAHRYALHIFRGLAHSYTDQVIEEAKEKWNIEFTRKEKGENNEA